MARFQLFRAKVIMPKQKDLFAEHHKGALLRAIEDRPSAELREGYRWHIGNVTRVDQSGLYFALGRTTRSSVERFDEVHGDFVMEEFETAPYTHVVVDLTNQVLGIAAKAKLAPTIPGIARQLEKLLGVTRTATELKVVFEVTELEDPEEFLGHLQSAYSVEGFDFSFSRPNPWDVNKDFVQPLEAYLQTVRGVSGKATVKGIDLDRGTLEDVARSAASSGHTASARIRRNEGDRPVRLSMKGNPVVFDEEEVETQAHRRGLLDRIRSLYRQVRRSEE